MALTYSGKAMKRDESKYMYYLKEAADLGHPGAQRMLGLAYESSNDEKMSLHYTTLTASQGDPKACDTEEGDPCDNPVPTFNLSLSLFHLCFERYEGIMEIPGHSPIPKTLHWARRALKVDPTNDFVIKFILMVENEAKSHCTNCRKGAEGSPLKRCVRCLGAWYCGKECQVQHWKAGHKLDCIKRK
eukprot:scaffold41036_cov95-Skeletonema_marinoi.AAC.2